MNDSRYYNNCLLYSSLILLAALLIFLMVPSGDGNSGSYIPIGEVYREAALIPSPIKQIALTNGSDEIRVVYSSGVVKLARRELSRENFTTQLENAGLDLTKGPDITVSEASPLAALFGLFFYLMPTLLLIGVLIFLMRRSATVNDRVLGIAKSKVHRYTRSLSSITFESVAGVDEAKQELAEIVEFLKFPQRFTLLGAHIPRGVLLVGPPGTGKTLLAKAVAGEAGVPFFHMSASEFIEIFAGVGASRVRDLFAQAKKESPCLIFIDEIDAVGRHREASTTTGNDEREQTLNQILAEMDGFETDTNVIVIAATNRPDILDSALLRPGRFDRRVTLDLPDRLGRHQILKVHARGKPFDRDVNLENVAKETPGFSGADLENLLNEAAILAARDNRRTINMADLDGAALKVIAGPERRSWVLDKEDRIISAYHEAGHALVASQLPTIASVRRISIIPRGLNPGMTLLLPGEDRNLNTRQELEEEIAWWLGGRAAEEIIFTEVSNRASDDLEKVNKIAREMVTTYGMSDFIGPVALSQAEPLILRGRNLASQPVYSAELAYQIDREVFSIVEKAFLVAKRLLNCKRGLLVKIAELLFVKENLEGEELEKLLSSENFSAGIWVGTEFIALATP